MYIYRLSGDHLDRWVRNRVLASLLPVDGKTSLIELNTHTCSRDEPCRIIMVRMSVAD